MGGAYLAAHGQPRGARPALLGAQCERVPASGGAALAAQRIALMV